MVKEVDKKNKYAYLIMILGIIIRFITNFYARVDVFQHDITFNNAGHFDYAKYIYENNMLPNTNYYEFAQPPINAYLQALVMKIMSFVINRNVSLIKLYSYTKILSFIFSVITLIIIYKIIKEFDVNEFLSNIFIAIFSFYPGLIIMNTQYSNDPISYMFFYLSIYIALIWIKNKKMSTIILLALSIGIGMLTKVSVGLVAFVVGPILLIGLYSSYREDKKNKNGYANFKNVILMLTVFMLIVFPIGLSYSVRNYILFGQKFGEIFDIAVGTKLDLSLKNYSIYDRYIKFAFDRLFDKECNIFHDYYEYNIWVDLIKTSTFDEFTFVKYYPFKNFYPLLVIIYILNLLFWFIGILSIGYNISYISSIEKSVDNFFINKDNKFTINSLIILSLLLFAIAIISYIYFNVRYARSCNSNYRYIAYITFALASSIISSMHLIKCKI